MPLFQREARVIPSLGYCRYEEGREMEHDAATLANDPEIAKALITHCFPIEDAGEAFRVPGDRSAGAIRVGDRTMKAEDQFHLGVVARSRAGQELRWAWPDVPKLHRRAVEPARIAAWRQGELLPDAGTASRRVEGLRVDVLFEYP